MTDTNLERTGGESLKRRGVRYYLLDGVATGAMCAVTDIWFIPLLTLCLGASGYLIGYLTILPMLGMVSFGLVARSVIKFAGGNRVVTLTCVAVQVAMCLGMIIPIECHFRGRMEVGLALCLIYMLIGSLCGPAWIAWIGDLIPRSLSGRISGTRFRLFQGVKLVLGLGVTWIFQRWHVEQHPHIDSAILAFAACARLASLVNIARIPVPPPRPIPRGPVTETHPITNLSFLAFLKGLGRTRIGIWTLVWSVMVFGCTISSPYVTAYLVVKPQDHGLALAAAPYWLLVNIAVLTRMLMVPLIGRAIDLYGATAMLRIGVLGVCFNVLPYVFTERLPVLYATEVFGGMSWCTVEIAMGVLLLSCNRDPLQRVRLIGYYQVVSGGAVLIGALLGQALLYQLSQLAVRNPHGAPHGSVLLVHGNPYHSLFLASFILRWPGAILAILLLPRLRPLNEEETRGLWRLVPGLSLSIWVSRSLAGVVRRSFG